MMRSWWISGARSYPSADLGIGLSNLSSYYWRFTPDGMIVAPGYRKCVAFLCTDETNSAGTTVMRPRATAFAIRVPLGPGSYVDYVVTAKHNVELARALCPVLYLKLNMRDGTTREVALDHDGWTPSPSNDVTARLMPKLEFPLHDTELTPLPSELIASDEWVSQQEVAEGDEVFVAGLYTGHPGQTRNLPVSRFGHVALMPVETVRIEYPGRTFADIDAYLIETLAFGGESGSPVFVHFPATRFAGMLTEPEVDFSGNLTDVEMDEIVARQARPYLLGLVHGHFNQTESVKDRRGSPLNDDERVSINSGIAIVVPAQALLDLLLGDDDLVVERERLRQKVDEERPVATADMDTSEESAFERFENLARKIVAVPKPEIDEKRET